MSLLFFIFDVSAEVAEKVICRLVIRQAIDER